MHIYVNYFQFVTNCYYFVNNLYSFAKTRQASILTMVHTSTSVGGSRSSNNQRLTISALMSQTLADVSLSISPLLTGSCPQITGHIQIRFNEKSLGNEKDNKKKVNNVRRIRLAQYKLDERNVRVTFLS
jgi:hypothetical protein